MIEQDETCGVCYEPAVHWCPTCHLPFCERLWSGVYVPYGCTRCEHPGGVVWLGETA